MKSDWNNSSCENCCYWSNKHDHEVGKDFIEHGHCHKNSPQDFPERFPAALKSDWCGEYRRVE